SGPTPTPMPPDTPTVDPREAADLEGLRRLTFAYWQAFNANDPETTLGYLEASYRAEREEAIRDEIGLIDTFGVTLVVSEQIPPHMTGPDEGEMFLRMQEPLGIRLIHMAFRRVAGEWKITYAQEVE
ncbi:MAG: hypothetical protein V3U26_02150, partial [Dehalococcoidia bacterium]